MKPELRKSLNDFMRILPGYKNLTDEEVEKKCHEDFMKIKLTEPLYWGNCASWRNLGGHILEDDETFLIDDF